MADHPVNHVANHGIQDGHVKNVGAQRHDTAVLKQKTLHNQHGGHHHHRRAGAEQGGYERAAHQMAGCSARHRKIHHLRGEQKRR